MPQICIVVFKNTGRVSFRGSATSSRRKTGDAAARVLCFLKTTIVTNLWQKFSFTLGSAFFRTLVPDLTTFIKRFYFIRMQRIRHTVKVECCNLTKYILYTESKIFSLPCYTDKFDHLIISLCMAARESKTQFTYNPHRYITAPTIFQEKNREL